MFTFAFYNFAPFAPWSVRSLELSLSGTSRELSLPGTFVLWNFRSHNVYLTVFLTKVDRRPTLCSVL